MERHGAVMEGPYAGGQAAVCQVAGLFRLQTTRRETAQTPPGSYGHDVKLRRWTCVWYVHFELVLRLCQ